MSFSSWVLLAVFQKYRQISGNRIVGRKSPKIQISDCVDNSVSARIQDAVSVPCFVLICTTFWAFPQSFCVQPIVS